jgi:diguanylate cyclase (GGDEF)-like protein
MHRWLTQRSPCQGILLGTCFILLIGLLDGLTGYHLRFGIFYLLPIYLVTWTAGHRAGALVSLLSGLLSLLADLSVGKPLDDPLIDAWSFLVTLTFYLIMVTLLARFQQALQTAERLARSDSLTGLANRHAFFEAAARDSARCRRAQQPLTIIYIDCDGFKMINDAQGHEVGDDVLRTIGEALPQQIRASDTAARLGGDEFAVLLPDMESRAAQAASVRLRHELLAAMQRHGWPVTFSVGVATFVHPPADVNTLVRQADDLMYQVKRQGKNAIAAVIIPRTDQYQPAIPMKSVCVGSKSVYLVDSVGSMLQADRPVLRISERKRPMSDVPRMPPPALEVPPASRSPAPAPPAPLASVRGPLGDLPEVVAIALALFITMAIIAGIAFGINLLVTW